MKISTTIALLLFSLQLLGQNLDFKNDFEIVSQAMRDNDIKKISEYAPTGDYGVIDFISPKSKAERILKKDFEDRLTKLFNEYPLKEFELLEARQTEMNLPLGVGKYVTKDNKKYYVLMMFAKFDKTYGFLTFHVVDKLPSNLKSLDR